MPSDTSGLPKGLSVKRQGESLEVAHSKEGDAALLFSEFGSEVVKGTLRKGERITIVPAPSEEGVSELYFLLQGVLRYASPDTSLELRPNDYLIASDLAEPAVFEAEMDIQFLYFARQPSFHHISQELGDLRELAVEVEMKDGYTADHCKRLKLFAYKTGKLLNLPHERLHYLDYGAYLHDVGKVDVPTALLNKPAPLAPREWAIVQKHPVFGKEMVEQTFMKEAAPIVEQHHERFDGSGYPHGLSRHEIMTEAYIVAVADTYDAMTSNRPYRQALEHDHAVRELLRLSNRHYPSYIVDAFLEVVNTMQP